MDYEAFRDNTQVFYAANALPRNHIRASRRLGDDVKNRQPQIRWRNIAAAGNIYRHTYEDVQQQLVWSTIRDHLPPLLAAVEAELARF